MIAERLCKFCDFVGSDSDFYKSDRNKCKPCVRETVRKNRVEVNREYYLEYDRTRNKTPERIAKVVAYQQTDTGKLVHQKAQMRWRESNPIRRAAQVAVGHAIRDGRLTPWPCCAVPECEDPNPPHAHHPDYSRPLDVVWLCPQHHKDAHGLVPLLD